MDAQIPNIWVKILLVNLRVNYRSHGVCGRTSIWGQVHAYGRSQPSYFRWSYLIAVCEAQGGGCKGTGRERRKSVRQHTWLPCPTRHKMSLPRRAERRGPC